MKEYHGEIKYEGTGSYWILTHVFDDREIWEERTYGYGMFGGQLIRKLTIFTACRG